MAVLTGYFLYSDVDASGLSVGDGISGGSITTSIDTEQHYPLGSGSVSYPNTLGDVSGTFYQGEDGTYFVPEDDSNFPPWEAGTVSSYTEAIEGTSGDDTIVGTSGDDIIHDTDGSIHDTTGSDYIDAGMGADTIIFGDGDDTVLGGDGDDLIGQWANGSGSNTLYGGAGDDAIIGGAGDDVISGGAGDDWLTGAQGDDTILGGDGMDEIWVTDDHDSATIEGGEGGSDWDLLGFSNWETSQGVAVTYTGDEAGSFDFYGSATSGSFTEIEQVTGTWFADRIDASADSAGTSVAGESGDDTIIGGSGDDRFWGGGDNDTLSGGAGNDQLWGDDGSDTLTGGTGSDVLYGGDGNDTFLVSQGDEQTDIHGGGWWDTLVLGDGSSTQGATVTYSGSGEGKYELGNASGAFSSIEMVETTDQADTIDASADSFGLLLVTDGGDDTVEGGSAADQMWLGDGADSARGGDGSDRIYGGAGDDTIEGGAGDDTLKGEDGDDRLVGGAGDDTLTGGAGDDVFAVLDGDGHASITDFTLAGDEMDQLDVSELTDANGNPVDLDDVSVGADDFGNAILSFPMGESLTLEGIDASTLDRATLHEMGIPCFTVGTLILTPRGEVPIETLQPGDLVQTLDNGAKPVLWIGQRRLGRSDLLLHPGLAPIRIREGALGNRRDLLVSPQHCVLTTPDGAAPCMARATHLARKGGPGFRVARGVREVRYIHLMFERHQVVLTEGLASESFYPGPMALGSLDDASRAEVGALFPDLVARRAPREEVSRFYGPTARAVLRRREVSRRTAAEFRPRIALA